MTKQRSHAALSKYRRIGVQSGVESASPHRLIAMLMQGVLDRISTAMGHMQRSEIEQKGRQISLAITIIGGLSASLDHEQGGEIAADLARLYDYMTRRLVMANLKNDTGMLEEVHGLMRQIKEGWDGMPRATHPPQAARAGAAGPLRGAAPAGA